LKPGGEVLISIPNGFGPYEIEQFLIRVGVLGWALVLVKSIVALGVAVKRKVRGQPSPKLLMPVENTESGHIQHFSIGSFSKLTKAAGLDIAEHANGAWFGGDLSYFAFYFFP